MLVDDIAHWECLERQQFFESILDSAADPMVAITFDKRIIWMNRAARELTQPGLNHQIFDIRCDSQDWICGNHAGKCAPNLPCPIEMIHGGHDQAKTLREFMTPAGERRVYELYAKPLRALSGEAIGIVKSLRDVTEHLDNVALLNEKEQALTQLAQRDPLTGLANRALAMERLDFALRQAHRGDDMVGLIYIDLVGFKRINDSMGHETGDEVLRKVAQRLGAVVREVDTVARLGGDEFLIILDRLKHPGDAAIVADKLILSLREPMNLRARVLNISGSLGISVYPTDGNDADTLLRHADQAMYRAKRGGSIEAHFHTPTLPLVDEPKPSTDKYLIQALEEADEHDFLVLYQPVVDLADNRIIKVEALLRWNHREFGILAPERFLPLAESSGLIKALDDWVLLTVCQQFINWRDQGLNLPCISVNLSAKQLGRDDLPNRLTRILAITGCPARAIELEFAELSVMADPEHNREVLEQLRGLGVSLCIDDFGAGYASLNQLKLLPIDHLKLDRALVRQLPGDGREAAFARAILALGQSMKMNIVAKGIETEDQRDFLRAEGCHHGQGYLYGKPLSSEGIVGQLPH
jgi:diguanylate cyclase (GGDEF)-like protein